MSQHKLWLGVLVCIVTITNLFACKNAELGAAESETLTWEIDIAWLRDTLPQLHYNLFMYVPEDNYVNALNNLEDNLSLYDDMEIAMELTRILASMKCSHTGISFWKADSLRFYPISLIWLESGLYVTGIHSDYSELIGARLIEFDTHPALEAAGAMAEMFPYINEVSQRTSAENFLQLAHCMQALGYGDTDSDVSFAFLNTLNDTVIVDLSSVRFPDMQMTDMDSVKREGISLPIFLTSDANYWFTYLAEREMLYCAYNSCALIEGYDMNAFIEEMNETLNRELVRHITVDLRRNGGGNSFVANPLIDWLEAQALREDLVISLIIGRSTYSSGILNSIQISEIPGVVVYGEETSGAPNHLGEVRIASLPYSEIQVYYPTKYFEVADGLGATMVPDVSIPLTPEMLFSGKNSVLDAICPPLN